MVAESPLDVEKIVKNVKFTIQRYDPDKGDKYYGEFEVPVTRGTTILDSLFYIKENMDSSLVFRSSCRMSTCGSCSVSVNGIPRLACHTRVLELNKNTVEIRPLRDFPIVRDLVVELKSFLDKEKSVKSYLIRRDIEEQEHPVREYLQKKKELDAYIQFSGCLKCGLCYSACPVTSTDKKFLGPQALSQIFRYIIDSRDEGEDVRMPVADGPHGSWRCHFAGACSMVCPKGVDPALAIQLLKRRAISQKLARKMVSAAPIAPIPITKPQPGIPKPPAATV